jgi:hypothetical protein
MSGIAFGVAGAALVVLLQEALEPARRRREAPAPDASTTNRQHGKTRRKVVWIAGGVVALAGVIIFAVLFVTQPPETSVPVFSTANGVPPTSSVLITDNCFNSGRIEPTSIVIACADGGLILEDLTWSQWNSKMAAGNGIADVVNCIPSCATGAQIAYQVDVKLSAPARVPNGPFYFTNIALFYPGRRPSSLSDAHADVFHFCAQGSAPVLPYYPRCPRE